MPCPIIAPLPSCESCEFFEYAFAMASSAKPRWGDDVAIDDPLSPLRYRPARLRSTTHRNRWGVTFHRQLAAL